MTGTSYSASPLSPGRGRDCRFPDGLIAFGPLLSDDGTRLLGVAALLPTVDARSAGDLLPPGRFDGNEVHEWRTGGGREKRR